MYPEVNIAGTTAAQKLHGPEQDIQPLEGVDLSEKGEAVARPVFGRRVHGTGHQPCVLLETELVRGNAPLLETLEQEPARTDEEVHHGKLGLDEFLAHEKGLRRN